MPCVVSLFTPNPAPQVASHCSASFLASLTAATTGELVANAAEAIADKLSLSGPATPAAPAPASGSAAAATGSTSGATTPGVHTVPPAITQQPALAVPGAAPAGTSATGGSIMAATPAMKAHGVHAGALAQAPAGASSSDDDGWVTVFHRDQPLQQQDPARAHAAPMGGSSSSSSSAAACGVGAGTSSGLGQLVADERALAAHRQ
jgi:hypothetical protein